MKKLLTEWEKNLCQLYIWQGINNQYSEVEKLNSPPNQWPKEEMGKLMEQSFFKGKSSNGQKPHEEMLPGHKGNANQNHIKILSHSF
jgi:hypothetical protein